MAQTASDNRLRAHIDAAIAEGTLSADPAQDAAIAALDETLDRLSADRQRRTARKQGALGWLFGARPAAEPGGGLYLWGGVGRGKTMLMDAFFAMAPVRRKRRVHFHAFMADVHERIHAFRQAMKEEGGAARTADPIPPLADRLAEEARLLCFDEFAVTDVADAMILSRLFTCLFERGVDIVATSNVAPRDLYRDGLNRSFFLPFIDLVEQRMAVIHLDSATDHRMATLSGGDLYLTGEGRRARFDDLWARATAGVTVEPASLEVSGRKLTFEQACGGLLRTDFDRLCRKALGAKDYLALAERFHTLFLEGVPVMEKADRNAAKRFIALVDTFYDRERLMVVAAEATPDELYRATSGTEAFEFARTVSRLTEMQGEAWRERVGAGG